MQINLKPNGIQICSEATVFETESDFFFYMRRGEKYYFRNQYGRSVLELKDAPKEFAGMKYGTKVKIQTNK